MSFEDLLEEEEGEPPSLSSEDEEENDDEPTTATEVFQIKTVRDSLSILNDNLVFFLMRLR